MSLALPLASAPSFRGNYALASALAIAFAAAFAAGCASSRPRSTPLDVERGTASWYGPGFDGRATASGETYDMHQMTAAHRTLPFGTVVEVRNLANGLTTQVRINDRGPFRKNRIIDLSNAAARAIEMIGPGTAPVELRVLSYSRASSRYVVQLGAFQERQLALDLRASIAGRYPDVEVRSDAVWHRVQLGDFASREEAEAERAKLERAGFTALVLATPAR
jgi:rare lipoprotein A